LFQEADGAVHHHQVRAADKQAACRYGGGHSPPYLLTLKS
jgi:hypothetical protein